MPKPRIPKAIPWFALFAATLLLFPAEPVGLEMEGCGTRHRAVLDAGLAPVSAAVLVRIKTSIQEKAKEVRP